MYHFIAFVPTELNSTNFTIKVGTSIYLDYGEVRQSDKWRVIIQMISPVFMSHLVKNTEKYRYCSRYIVGNVNLNRKVANKFAVSTSPVDILCKTSAHGLMTKLELPVYTISTLAVSTAHFRIYNTLPPNRCILPLTYRKPSAERSRWETYLQQRRVGFIVSL